MDDAACRFRDGQPPTPGSDGSNAVKAAVTWCQLMLDTLTDPAAPWHTTP